MTSSLRLYAGSIALSALLVLIAVLGSRGGAGGSGEPLPPTLDVNRIAYVGTDGLIHSVNPDGSEPIRISPEEGVFTWPTWSPDARRLVFSGAVEGETGDPDISLFSLNLATGQLDRIYTGEKGIFPFITQDGSVIHYPMWSPDAKSLTFIAQTSRGLSLFLDNLHDQAEARLLLDQGPLWSSWSPDSAHVAVHRGEDHFLVSALGEIEVRELGIQSSIYRVPAWTPDGQGITVMERSGASGYTLYTAGVKPEGLDDAKPIADLRPYSTFMWSPRGDRLAIARSADILRYGGGSLVVYDRLDLKPKEGDTEPTTVRDAILAYFWSPDGARIAYVALSESPGALRWKVMDAETGASWRLVDFLPSRDQLTMFEFFDQYAYSHSLWSPDGMFLVFSGNLRGDTATASAGRQLGQPVSKIIVLDAEPNAAVSVIADGVLGFWSPR